MKPTRALGTGQTPEAVQPEWRRAHCNRIKRVLAGGRWQGDRICHRHQVERISTNTISGILAYSLTGAQSNVTSLVLRAEDNTPRAASLLTNQPSCFQINPTNDFHDTFRVFPNLVVNNGSASVTIFGLNFADTNYAAVASFDFAAGSYTWSAKTTTSITFNVTAPGADSHADVILKAR